MSDGPQITEPVSPRGGGRGFGHPMNPRTARRIALFGSIGLVLFGVLILRLWFLQVVGASDSQAQASANTVRTINIPAPRGDIVDRRGRKLATTQEAVDLVAVPQDVGVGVDYSTGDVVISPQGQRTLARIAKALGEKPARLQNLMINGQKKTPYKSVVLKADIDPEDDLYFALNERLSDFPGLRLEKTQRRTYIDDGTYISHALGWVGQIPAGSAEAYQRQGYRNDAIVGISGLESKYEPYLRGTDGERKVEVDATGEPTSRGVISERPAKTGSTLVTSIDYDVQKALSNALREKVETSSISGGGGVVMDVKSGEVIALASYPQIPIADVSSGRNTAAVRAMNDENNKRKPGIDRALWAYPPASTFKAVTALAALQTGMLKADEFLSSPKEVPLFGTVFKNFRGQEQPNMQLPMALTVSSDTYFYQVGARLIQRTSKRNQLSGHTKLYEWAKAMGYGTPTGIDIAGEQSGVLPDRLWKAENLSPNTPDQKTTWDKWRKGDTINMSVGQGDLKATPLQVARAYAAIANGGTLVQPHIGILAKDPVSGNPTADLARGLRTSTMPKVSPENLDAVKKGLSGVANNSAGTAASVFGRFGGLVAGKTGTAESGDPDHDHAWFVGYGPTDDPKYVVAVVIEYSTGTGGSVAAPVACQAIATAIGGVDPTHCGDGSTTELTD